MKDTPALELPPRYYRDNFLSLCDTVEARYEDLLLPAEQDFLQDFRELPEEGQCLYVRLVSRVGPWFRSDRLHYPEIDDLPSALAVLRGKDLVQEAPEWSTQEMGRLFTREELLAAFSDRFSGDPLRNKAALLDAVEALPQSPAEKLGCLLDSHGGEVIAPLGTDTVGLFQLLFFGNRRQSLTEFVLSELGIARYYPYDLEEDTRLFPHREALREYLACAALSDRHRELQEEGDRDALVELGLETRDLKVEHRAARERWYRLGNRLARDLERVGEDELAGQLYARSSVHPARERRARILERLGDIEGAMQMCTDILAAPWCEREADAAGRILPRLRRKAGQKTGRKIGDRFSSIALALPREDDAVELLVARHLSAAWPSVHFVENTLMNALFGLAFWEQIFAPVPGVFHNPYQGGPSDMFDAAFRERRENQLEQRLQALQSVDLREELLSAFDRYRDYQCRWVNWRYLDRDLVAEAAHIIPRQHLLSIWRRMLFDPRENRSGFPDLLALGPRPGDYCLVEVKGPGDALQDSQKRWLRFFSQEGIPATVAWVNWSDA